MSPDAAEVKIAITGGDGADQTIVLGGKAGAV